jgi:hypothetical protein
MVPHIAMKAAGLEVAMTMRSPVGVDKSGDVIFSEQEMQADLILVPDELHRLGSVRRGVVAVERKGVPLLKSIPLVRYLFSSEVRIIRETELFVFVRPTWTSPLLPAKDAMKIDTPLVAEQVKDILGANPNLSMSPEDTAVLERYLMLADESAPRMTRD